MNKKYASFEEFWPDYVRAHKNKTNRQLHFVGSTLALACVGGALVFRRPLLLLAAPLVGYGFAWVGHFGFEKNSPASFTNPIYSFQADWVMWSKIANGTMDAEVEHFTAEERATDPEAVDRDADAHTHQTNGAPVDLTSN